MRPGARNTGLIGSDSERALGNTSEAANAEWLTARPVDKGLAEMSEQGNLVVILGSDGVVRSQVGTPTNQDTVFPDMREGDNVADHWPAHVATLIRNQGQRALRTREVRSIRVRIDELDCEVELIFIAQSRDAVMLVVRDISGTSEKISRLEQMAFEDHVTGLPNKQWLINELTRALGHQNLHGGRSALILLEVDRLDLLDNIASMSHRDNVLGELGRRLRHGLRGANLNQEDDDERYSAVAHLDGRCFGILLPSIETGEDAESVAIRVTEMLESPVEVSGKISSFKVATGIALHPQDGKTADELFESAAVALNEACNSQTGKMRFHSGTVRMRAIERQDLQAELRSALDNEEFSLRYQPIIARDSGEIVAAEALLRWPKPLFGAKSIRDVIAVADYTGLIQPIGEWVFRVACEQVVAWHADGWSRLKVAVNLSPQEFAIKNLAERIAEQISASAVPADNVVLEITEQMLFRDSVDGFPICRALKDAGVSIAVDDYGTGVCSFDQLSRSPVDSVKIHPDIVARAADGSPSRAACAAVTAMAHALGIRVVAEGVETEEQATILREIGCDYLQGFLFGMPSEPEQIISMLAGSGTDSN